MEPTLTVCAYTTPFPFIVNLWMEREFPSVPRTLVQSGILQASVEETHCNFWLFVSQVSIKPLSYSVNGAD